jgi:lipopolysaccharide assembly outer membrane protein LptD (OstA)
VTIWTFQIKFAENILKKLIRTYTILAILMFAMLSPSFSQRRVRIEHSDYTEGGRKDGQRYFKVMGNVYFIQDNTNIWCDSAFLYRKDNRLEAYGHIRIFDTIDSVTITSNRLEYDGDSKFANLRENVVYKEDSVSLYTDFLDYDLFSRSAFFFNGGKINDGENILTSKKGYYNSTGKSMSFKTDVELVNPENTLKADSLYYDMVTKVARTIGPTVIISSDGTILNSEMGGDFNMRINKTTILAGEIETESYILRGDELYYDRDKGTNSAAGNVYMFSKEDDIIITGQMADNDELNGITKIYGQPLLKKLFEEDTLYLVADTLISMDDSLDVNKKLLAYHNVRIYRQDLQGKADSLLYALSDSVLYLYNDPVLWSEGNQIEADSMNIEFRDNQIHTLNLQFNSFMVLKDSLDHYNQLKGKNMTGYFQDNKINQLNVDGNSECIFFALDEEDQSLTGVNKILCSSMVIRFVDNRADNMSFYTNPEATFIPPHELNEPDTRLKGFVWREDERPTLENILKPPPIQEIESEEEVQQEPSKIKRGKTIPAAKIQQ